MSSDRDQRASAHGQDYTEQLSPVERRAFGMAQWFARGPQERLGEFWRRAIMARVLRVFGGWRFRVHGKSHFDAVGPQDSFLMISNHRTFFDFYVISTQCVKWKHFPRRLFFPVRSEFFYTSNVGILVNLVMSAMAMYPPVVRERERTALNRYCLQLCEEELRKPGTVLGIHPEGRRNKGEDPYALLSSQNGVARLALATGLPVYPAFILGMSNSLPLLIWRNWTRPWRYPIDILFGPRIDPPVLDREPTESDISDFMSQCMEALQSLAQEHREGPSRRQGAR